MSTRDPITPAEAFEGLPDEIREAIEGSGWQEKLRHISSKAHLRVDQGAALEDETLRFMAGLQTVEEYAVHLAQEIPMPEQDFKNFVGELERDIFMPVQERLKKALPDEEDVATTAAASVGEHEEDDLEALLNDESAMENVVANAPAPVATPSAPVATPLPAPIAPVAPIVAVSTPIAAPSVTAAAQPSPDFSAAAQKLAAPVTKPAETVTGNLQRPSEPLTPPKTSSDPYREPFN